MKKRETLVSIIIPAHNEEKYIEDTLLHVKKQSYKNIETIVVDNGSSDKTASIAKKYSDKVIITKKKGVSYARNLGAKKARGKVLVFLDADTILWDKNTISKILRHAGESNYGTCRMKPDKIKHFPYTAIKNLLIKYGNFRASNGLIFIKKEIHHKIGGFNEKKDKEEIFEYFSKAGKHGKFKFVKAYVMPSMRRGGIKTVAYWIGIKIGMLKNKPYPSKR